MGDQKGAELGLPHLAGQHQVHRLTGLGLAQALAGVLTAAHLGEQLTKTQGIGSHRRPSGLFRRAPPPVGLAWQWQRGRGEVPVKTELRND